MNVIMSHLDIIDVGWGKLEYSLGTVQLFR